MKNYIQAFGVDVWDVVEEEYQKHPKVVTKYHKMEFTSNAKAMNSMIIGILESKLVNVMDYTSSKSI